MGWVESGRPTLLRSWMPISHRTTGHAESVQITFASAPHQLWAHPANLLFGRAWRRLPQVRSCGVAQTPASPHHRAGRPPDLVDATALREKGHAFYSALVQRCCRPGVRLASQFATASVPVQSWSEIAQRVIPCIVNIWVEKTFRADDSSAVEQLKTFSGSGFVVNPSGEIVTNKHLIEGALSITVTLHDGTQLPGELIAAASLADVAVLKVNPIGHFPRSSLLTAMLRGWVIQFWLLAIRLG